MNDNKKGKRIPVKSRRRVYKNWRPLIGDKPEWVRKTLIGSVIIGIILSSLGYDFITNSGHATSFISIIFNSFSQLPNKNNAFSLGVLALVITTWIICVLLFSIENEENENGNNWLRALGLMALASLLIGLLFWVLHAISLATLEGFVPSNQIDVVTQVNSIGAMLTKFYIYIFLIIILVAFIIPHEWPQRRSMKSQITIFLAPILLITLFILTNISNLKVVHADITFKMAEPFTKSGQWQVATFLYQRALEQSPREDHYYLFLGRSYLEQAKITESTEDQNSLVLQAEDDLNEAQSINPLNTDHTANLARLYSWWAGKATTADERSERGLKASAYYATAVTLSPNNSTLWDEWAVLFLQVFGQTQEAYERLQHALSLDDRYSFTQGLFGDYYIKIASSTTDKSAKVQALETAAEYYRTAADVAKKGDTTPKASYLVSLGNVYIMLAGIDPQNVNRDKVQKAIDILKESLDAGISTSDQWRVQEAIAKLYMQLGEKILAQYYANQSLANAPSSATSRIQDLIANINSLP